MAGGRECGRKMGGAEGQNMQTESMLVRCGRVESMLMRCSRVESMLVRCSRAKNRVAATGSNRVLVLCSATGSKEMGLGVLVQRDRE